MQFYSHKLFQNGPEVTLSYHEVAELHKVSIGVARRYIHKDHLSGMIFKICHPFRKNCYRLTILGFHYLHQNLFGPIPELLLDHKKNPIN